MVVQPLRIAVLHYQPPGESEDAVVGQIGEALRQLGHSVVPIGVNESVRDLLRLIEEAKGDLVFNICETFADDYRLEVNVAALLEMARVPFTGSGTAGLLLAQDKILTKQILDYHEVSTPRFATFDGVTFETRGSLSFPLIVKPAKSDASIGLEVVKDWDGLTRRIREIRREYDDDAVAEEFIEGRELYVGVIGDARRPEILPIVELDFGANWDKAQLQIADRDVKFGPETQGSPRLVIAQGISDELRGRIERSALLAYRALKLRDYARIDLRVSAADNDPYVLEVNPNPYLEAKSELAMAAQQKGVSYTQLIGRIVDSAAARFKLYKKQPQEPKPDAKAHAAEAKPDAKAHAAEAKPDAKTHAAEPKPDAKAHAAETKPDAKAHAAEAKPDAKAHAAEAKPDAKAHAAEAKPDAKAHAAEAKPHASEPAKGRSGEKHALELKPAAEAKGERTTS